MSGNLTIKKLLNLDESIFTKMSNITLEATVKQVGQAYERKVKSGKRAGEPFYSQKLTVEDSTGAIVVDFIANKAEQTIPKTAVGKRIKIEDAKTDIYKDEYRLARGKVTFLIDSQRVSSGEVATPTDDYYIVVGPNGKIVLNPEVDKQKRSQLLREGIAKSFIEATQKWNKTIEKQAQESFVWVDGKEEPKDELGLKPPEFKKPKPADTEGLVKVMDKDFNRDKLIGRLGKRFGELFVAGKTKGLNLEEWLNKNYEVKSFMGLSDDYLVELDTVFNDMEGEK